MEPISERFVQAQIASLLRGEPRVRAGMLEAVGQEARIAVSRRPVVRQGVIEEDGESDLQIDWTGGATSSLRLLVEVKLDAGFQPRQGERYLSRLHRSRSIPAIGEAHSVLVAPRAYLDAANPAARFFEYQVPLEDIAFWGKGTPEAEIIAEALGRLERDAPLGAKGLFQGVHYAVAEACARRGNGLVVTNRPTDWMMLAHPDLPTGVGLNYRIRQANAEIRVLASFRGNRKILEGDQNREVVRVFRGGEIFLRLHPLAVSEAAKSGSPTPADALLIVEALERLLAYWREIAGDGPERPQKVPVVPA